MADRTRVQVIKAVLEDLRKLDRTGTVSAYDATRVQDRYDGVITTLRNNDIIDIVDPVSAVPEEAFMALVAYLIQACALAFNVERDAQLMKFAENELRSVDRNGRTVADTVAARLAARVLRQLKVIDPGAAPSTKETAMVTDRVNATLADLRERAVIYIDDVEDVEASGAFDALADYIAAEGFTEYQREAQTGRAGPLSLIKRNDAERRLRRLGAGEPSFAPLVGSYF